MHRILKANSSAYLSKDKNANDNQSKHYTVIVIQEIEYSDNYYICIICD